MKILINKEINQVAAGRSIEDAITLSAKVAFYTTLFGTPVSAVYAFVTDTTVVTTVGAATTISGSFLGVFWSGVGISCVGGLLLAGCYLIAETVNA